MRLYSFLLFSVGLVLFAFMVSYITTDESPTKIISDNLQDIEEAINGL